MIALAFSLLAQSLTCRVGFLAHGVDPAGRADCYVDTDAGVVIVSRHRLRCARGTRAVVELDGRTARCRRLRGDA